MSTDELIAYLEAKRRRNIVTTAWIVAATVLIGLGGCAVYKDVQHGREERERHEQEIDDFSRRLLEANE